MVLKGEYHFFARIHNFASINCCQDSLLILKISLSETVNKLWSVNEYFYLVNFIVLVTFDSTRLFSTNFWQNRPFFYLICLFGRTDPLIEIGRLSSSYVSFSIISIFLQAVFLGSSHPFLSLFHSFSKIFAFWISFKFNLFWPPSKILKI